MGEKFDIRSEVLKVADDLGVVLGWGIVCTEDGYPYFDSQDDHIPESAMLEAVTDFMKSARIAGVQHGRDGDNAPVIEGTIVHSFPLTEDTAKAFGITCAKTGWMIGMAPDDPAVLAKFRSGELTGFSIGGRRILDEAA